MAARRIKDVRKAAAMPLKKAVSLCTGASFWLTKSFKKYDVPALRMSDGPHGIRRQDRGGGFGMLGVQPSRPATCFPSAVTLAASWDDSLLADVGKAIGEEARGHGVGVVLGPGVNIKRSPLCGRNFEYYSEDPYLSGKLAAAYIRGVQSTGVAACLKHFAANSQERDRFLSDSVVDERTLREIYLTAFELAVREGHPKSVMCAYNKLNGVYCSDDRRLLTDILRGEWGFDGLVVTDWGAMHNRVAAFRAGCDLNMPGGSRYGERDAVRAVKSGKLDKKYIERSAARVAELARSAREALHRVNVYDITSHHALARRAACEGAVLLKNEDGLLPLKAGTKLAVIGHMARRSRYQGSGSSHVNPAQLTHPIDNLPFIIYADGCDSEGRTTEEQLAAARTAAQSAEAAVVFAGLPESFESEGFDRENMRLPDGVNALISAVAEANANTCVVLYAGSAVECPWADEVRAILYMGLPGEAGGEAAADIIYGRAEPGGRLAESWPYRYEDVPSAEIYDATRDALYMEGVYVGYRYYASAGVKVRWPFGHGLSLTSWEYSDLSVSRAGVEFTVTNTGKLPGSEVAQLYVEPPECGIHRPRLELQGYARVTLGPGESRRVSIPLSERSFAVWYDGWKVCSGEYVIHVGSSSEDIRLSGSVRIEGVTLPTPASQPGSWYETLQGRPDMVSWERTLGHAYTPKHDEVFDMDSTPYEMRTASKLMRFVYNGMHFVLGLGFGKDRDNRPEYRMMISSSAMAPLRMLEINGGIPHWLLNAALKCANRALSLHNKRIKVKI